MIYSKRLALWPVENGSSCLVATHWPPDIDGLATGAAWCLLALQKNPSHKVALYCPESLPNRLGWLIENIPIETECPAEKYDCCLVIDCEPTFERTKIPEKWLNVLKTTCSLYSVDHHSNSGAKHDGQQNWIEMKPATACSFIDRGLFHQLFFASIWTDTRGFTLNTSIANHYLSRLLENGLKQEEITRQLRLLQPPRPEILFRDLCERTSVVENWYQGGIGHIIVVASTKPWRHVDTIHEVRELLTNYADVMAVMDVHNQRISLWCKEECPLDLGTLAHKEFGGGGHRTMAGGPLDNKTPDDVASLLKDYAYRCSPRDLQLKDLLS